MWKIINMAMMRRFWDYIRKIKKIRLINKIIPKINLNYHFKGPGVA
jgi:hypothetical protein